MRHRHRWLRCKKRSWGLKSWKIDFTAMKSFYLLLCLIFLKLISSWNQKKRETPFYAKPIKLNITTQHCKNKGFRMMFSRWNSIIEGCLIWKAEIFWFLDCAKLQQYARLPKSYCFCGSRWCCSYWCRLTFNGNPRKTMSFFNMTLLSNISQSRESHWNNFDAKITNKISNKHI